MKKILNAGFTETVDPQPSCVGRSHCEPWRRRKLNAAIGAVLAGTTAGFAGPAFAGPPAYSASDVEWNPATFESASSHVVSLRGLLGDRLSGQAPLTVTLPAGNDIDCAGGIGDCADSGSFTATVSSANDVCLTLAYTFPGEAAFPQTGSYSLPDVQISNGEGSITLSAIPLSSNSGTPAIASNCAYTAPTAGNDSFTVQSSASGGTPSANLLSGIEGNDSDADGDLVGFNAVVAGPSNGALSIAGGQGTGTTSSVIYTPNEGFTGSDQFTYTVFDSSSNGSVSNVATVALTVANEAPVLTIDGEVPSSGIFISVSEGLSRRIELATTDRENGSLSYSFSDIPAFCSPVDAGNGTATIDCTPSFTDEGSYSLGVSVADDGSPIATVGESISLDVLGGQPPVIAPLTTLISVSEAEGNAVLAVGRSGTPELAVSVDYAITADSATAGEDYTPVSGTLSWPANDTGQRTITVPIIDDAVFEPGQDETFSIVLSNPAGGAVFEPDVGNSAEVSIADNDTQPTVSFVTAETSISEDAPSVSVVVQRGGGLPQSGLVTVAYATADGLATAGEDYLAQSGTLSWSGADTTDRTITVSLSGDAVFESPNPETFSVLLSNPSQDVLIDPTASTVVSLLENESASTLGFALDAVSVDEAGSAAQLTVVRTGTPEGSVSVQYQSADGTATAGADYIETLGTLSWTDGDSSSRSIAVPILDDAIFESSTPETLLLALSSVTGDAALGLANATVSIVDDEVAPQVAPVSATVAVDEGAGQAVVRLLRSGSSDGSLAVDFASSDGTALAGEDYEAVSGTVTWLDSEVGERQILIPITADSDFEGDTAEQFSILLDDPSGTVDLPQNVITIEIADDEAAPLVAVVTDTLAVSEDAGVVTISVRRSGALNAASSVAFNTVPGSAEAGSDFTALSGTVSWDAGDGADKSIDIVILDDTFFENPIEESFVVALSDPIAASLGSPVEATVTITDNDLEAAGAGIAGPDLVVAVDPVSGEGTAQLEAAISSEFESYEWQLDGAVVGTTPAIVQSLPPGEYTFELRVLTVAGLQLTDTTQVSVTRELVQSEGPLAEMTGLNDSQRTVAETLDSICGRLNTRSELTADEEDLREQCSRIILDGDGAQQASALTALSGRQITGQMTNMLEIGSIQGRNISQRMQTRRGGRQDALGGLALRVNGKALPVDALTGLVNGLIGGNAGEETGGEFGRLAFFITGELSFGEQDETERETGFDFDTRGISAGFDYRFSERLFAGIALGYGQAETDYLQNQGSLESDIWTVTGFGSLATDRYYVDALAAYGFADHELERNIRFQTGSAVTERTASGSADGDQISLGLEGGLNINTGKWLFNPNLSAFYVDAGIDGFSETGANGLNLRYGDQGNQSLTISGGMNLSYTVTTKALVLIPQLRLDYVYEAENDGQVISARFVNDPFANDSGIASPAILLRTDEPDDTYVTIGLGLSAQLTNGVSGFVDWQTVTAHENLSIDSFSFGLRWERLF